jgi:hypothetical protein
MESLRAEAAVWCRGKNGFLRLPIVLWFGYIFVRFLTDPGYQSFLWPLNLGFHEIGHLLFGYGGKFLGMAGGTLLEFLAPFFGMIHFYRQRDFFSVALCFGWLSTALFSIARYAADARQMAIPLVSLSWSTEVTHDWNYLLGQAGLLPYDNVIAFLFRALASVSMLVCLASGLWLVWRMVTTRDGSPGPQQNISS